MVNLAEQIRAVDRVGVDAGGDGLARVADCRQPRVHDVDVGLRDRREARLVQLPLLEVHEVERAVLRHRTAEAEAVLLLGHRQPGAGKSVVAIEVVVAEVAVQIPMRHIRAALRDHVHVPAERPAQFGLPARGDHLELVHGIDRVGNPAQRRCGHHDKGGPLMNASISGPLARASDSPSSRRRPT